MEKFLFIGIILSGASALIGLAWNIVIYPEVNKGVCWLTIAFTSILATFIVTAGFVWLYNFLVG